MNDNKNGGRNWARTALVIVAVLLGLGFAAALFSNASLPAEATRPSAPVASQPQAPVQQDMPQSTDGGGSACRNESVTDVLVNPDDAQAVKAPRWDVDHNVFETAKLKKDGDGHWCCGAEVEWTTKVGGIFDYWRNDQDSNGPTNVGNARVEKLTDPTSGHRMWRIHAAPGQDVRFVADGVSHYCFSADSGTPGTPVAQNTVMPQATTGQPQSTTGVPPVQGTAVMPPASGDCLTDLQNLLAQRAVLDRQIADTLMRCGVCPPGTSGTTGTMTGTVQTAPVITQTTTAPVQPGPTQTSAPSGQTDDGSGGVTDVGDFDEGSIGDLVKTENGSNTTGWVKQDNGRWHLRMTSAAKLKLDNDFPSGARLIYGTPNGSGGWNEAELTKPGEVTANTVQDVDFAPPGVK